MAERKSKRLANKAPQKWESDHSDEEEDEEDFKPNKKSKVTKATKKGGKKAAKATGGKKAAAKKAASGGKKKKDDEEQKEEPTVQKITFQKKLKPPPRREIHIPSGKAVVGSEYDIFHLGAPGGGGTVKQWALQNDDGYPVKAGKWIFFEADYIQACYHESVDASLMTEDYLLALSQKVQDESSNGFKGSKPFMDFVLTQRIGRYDWLMNGDPNKHCTFMHFFDKEKAGVLQGHQVLGEDFFEENWDTLQKQEHTIVWDSTEGGGVHFHPAEEYRYGYFCTSKDGIC